MLQYTLYVVMLADIVAGEVHEANSWFGEPETDDSVKLRGADGTVKRKATFSNIWLAIKVGKLHFQLTA